MKWLIDLFMGFIVFGLLYFAAHALVVGYWPFVVVFGLLAIYGAGQRVRERKSPVERLDGYPGPTNSR